MAPVPDGTVLETGTPQWESRQISLSMELTFLMEKEDNKQTGKINVMHDGDVDY